MPVAVAGPLLHTAVHGVIEKRRRDKVQGRFRLRLVDVLTLAGPAPVVERGQDRRHGVAWRYGVGIGKVRASRHAIRPSGQVVEAGDRRR